MKKLFILFACCLLTVVSSAQEAYTIDNLPNVHLQDASRYVCDPANILSPMAADSINRMLYALEEQTGIESVVAVLPTIGEVDCYDFAFGLGNKWGVGKAKNDNGLVVLLVTDQRCIQMVTGYGLEGHLPEKPYDIALDKATMLNRGFSVGEKINDYTITAILKCDYYFGYGIIGNERYTGLNVLTKECVKDATTLFPLIGREYNKDTDLHDDYNSQKLDYEVYVKKQLVDSTKYIYVGIFILLFVSLFVVYTTYLRDRHNEWCLYCSIGYSRRSIYLSIMSELLFTFIVAILAGTVITTAMVFILDALMMSPKGMMCQYFYPDKILEILCAFVLFFGLLQLPIRYALYKIRTIDAMEDDLY